MHFRAKIDSFFLTLIAIIILFLAVMLGIPVLIDYSTLGTEGLLTMTAIFLVTSGFLLWLTYDIHYVLYEEYLLVRGGPIRSRIPYDQITRVSDTKDIYTGYRILSAKKAIEIHYKTALLGSVKISPKDESLFLSELQRRAPHARFEVEV